MGVRSHPNHNHAAHRDHLAWAALITVGFAAIEALGGWWAGSLALLSDAGHMVTDFTALGLAALASRIAQRPPSERHSYGLGRAEVVAALANALFMLAIVIGIGVSSVHRLQVPQPVQGGAVAAIAAIGLAVNLAVAWTLSHGEQTLNTRGALLHVLGDLLGSVAALLAGVVIYLTGWTPIDPLLSLLICVLILYSSLRLLREAVHVLMEGVPLHLDLSHIGHRMAAADGVRSVHDLHVWAVSSGRIALSAHLVIDDLRRWPSVLNSLRVLLHDRYGIDHVTLQPEPETRRLEPMTPPDGHPARGPGIAGRS